MFNLIHQKDRGFTLLEMLAVLMIMGILMAIATPSVIAMMSRAKLSNSVEQVRYTLELSRSQSTQKNKQCNVYIPNGGNQIISDCLISADNTSSGINGVPPGLPSVKLDDQNDIKIENSDSSPLKTITYNVKGITQDSGIFVLSSRSNSNGEKKCLDIKNGVGLISIGTYIDTINPPCKVGQ